MKNLDNKRLQRQVKTLQRDLRKANRNMKTMNKAVKKGFGATQMPDEGPQKPTLGSAMKTILFGEGLEPVQVDPNSIPRDHIIDPRTMNRTAVMDQAGRGEDVLATDAFDAKLLFAAQIQNQKQGNTARRPVFIADACYNVEDAEGLQRWRKTHNQRQKDLQGKPLSDITEVEPVSVLAVQGRDAKALLTCLEEEENCYGSIGYTPASYRERLETTDDVLTEALNETDKILAIGPVGLDAVRQNSGSLPQQKALLKQQMEIAVDFAVPVIFQHRGAADMLRDVIDTFSQRGDLIGIWASPLTTQEGLEWMLGHGFYVAVDAQLTYLAQEATRNLVAKVPEDKLLLMSGEMVNPPETKRGQWQTPWFWQETMEALIAARKISEKAARHALMHQLNSNFATVFFGEEEA